MSRKGEARVAARRARAAGLLLHPTSLPGRFPIGDLGPSAIAMLDWMVGAGFTVWQVLPLGPTGMGDSPYNSLSAFAGNPLLISPEALVADGLLSPEALNPWEETSGTSAAIGVDPESGAASTTALRSSARRACSARRSSASTPASSRRSPRSSRRSPPPSGARPGSTTGRSTPP